MIRQIRNPKMARIISLNIILCLLFQIVFPTAALALTSGPGQEEFASFEPASTTDMVDLYTGDFNYNIPLLSVPGPNGGYPFSLSYHSGIGMEQEASWVGLGWTLNVGAITRNLRGLPDDFNGDAVTKTQHVKEAFTVSLDIPTKAYNELVGFPSSDASSVAGTSSSSSSVGQNLQIYYNNYRGLGTRYGVGFSNSSPLGLNISSDSQNGLGIGLSFNVKNVIRASDFSAGFSLGLGYNSRQGLQSFNFSTSASIVQNKTSVDKNDVEFNDQTNTGGESSISFATVFAVPKTNIKMKSTTIPFKMRLPLASSLFKFKSPVPISGVLYTSTIENKGVDVIPAVGYFNTSGQTNILRDFSRQDIMYSKKIPHLGTSSFTYDLYSQTGQGTGSMFRPYLNTFGILSDPQKVGKDRIRGGGLEVGVGGAINLHTGIDLEYGDGQNSSGPWMQIESFSDLGHNLQKLNQWSSANGEIDYEPFYFQVFGEKTGWHASEDQLGSFRGDVALRFEIQKEKRDKSWLTRHFKVSDNLISSETETPSIFLTGASQTKQQHDHSRTKRATSIETMTTAQAILYGFSKNVTYKDVSSSPTNSCAGTGSIVGKDYSKPSHHVSEISMLQPDGMRYVYGLPAYNNKQIDNVFAVDEDAGNVANYPTAEIHQGSAKEYGGINVGSTYDQFVSKNELPAYAHTWMLTTVLSADYLDVTNDGPTDDDFGYWVKFNYKKTATNYKWRVPYVKANYLDGFKNNSKDNKGSYAYGEKDIYVLASVETKTHVAVFETSCRQDAFEASGEYSNTVGAAARGPQTMQKLDKIKLFTKREYAKANPTPAKVVNFEYNYDLCPGIPNNSGATENVTVNNSTIDLNKKKGKLTLTKLFFTYENSTRGKLSPYSFSYGDINKIQENPGYDKLSMDRWSNYKNSKAYEYQSGATNVISYPYIEHPYTEQDPQYYKGSTGLVPAPWTLKEISLPTGGIIKIDYEPDDYAYVENKQAMRMFDICGLSKDTDLFTTSDLQTLAGNANRKTIAKTVETEDGNTGGGKNRVYFKMGTSLAQTLVDLKIFKDLASVPTSNTVLTQWFNRLYIDNLGSYVYFNLYSNLKSDDPADQLYDYVKGYAEIVPGSGGFLDASSSDYGYFTVKSRPLASPVNVTGMQVCPFTRATLEHLRANRSDAIYDNTSAPGGGNAAAQIMNLVAAIPTQFTDLMATTIGFNNYAYARDWGRNIQLNGYSTIRLCQPNFKKIGGGVRIKKILLNDNWSSNTIGVQDSEYGQEYDYTKLSIIGDSTAIISSGVAYEPLIGSEESALKSPIPYTNSIPLHGSYNLFMENPIMDSYYPGASVGYSKVTVRSIAPLKALAENATNKLKYSAAPITIHEFYTPKDFPVIFDKTDMNPGQPIRIPVMIPALLTSFTTRQAKSQGYSLILNDMAGKVKSITSKTKVSDQIISKQVFIYNTEKPYNEDLENRLVNKVTTLEIDVSSNYKIKYTTSILGQTHDMFIDMNEDAQKMKSFGLETNLDMEIKYPVFLVMIMPIPTVKVDESSMRTVVFNKIINRTGILIRVETTTNESTIITENLAYDIETGEPILTKVTNEFKDPIYNFSYPGHWYYDNMGGAYQNDKLLIDPPGNAFIPSDNNGYIDFKAVSPYTNVLNSRKVSEYFAKGDVVLVKYKLNNSMYAQQFHVFNIDDAYRGMLLIDNHGAFFPVQAEVSSIEVLRSGFKNMQSTKVGSLVFKSMDPVFLAYNSGSSSTLNPIFNVANGTMNNHIINASAIEYSNDWQVFCGDTVEGKQECICTVSPVGYAFLSMLQSLNASGWLYNKEVEVYNGFASTCSNGFSNILLNSSQQMLSIAAQAMLVNINGALVYFGQISGNSLNVSLGLGNGPEGCNVKIDLPTGLSWGDVQYFTSIKPSLTAGDCNPTGGPNTSPRISSDSCQASPCVLLEIVMKDGSTVNANMTVLPVCTVPCGCWIFQECYKNYTPNYACGIPIGLPINPYWAGMKGIWRPKASYAYNSGRTQTNDIREDGVFTDFVRFPWEKPATKSAKWVNATTITKYSPYGFELENKDALGNYSSALYGYDHSLVTAIGSNAKYTELAFENFEDYPPGCNDNHFRYKNYLSDTTSATSHTGKFSLKVSPSSTAFKKVLMDPNCIFLPIDDITDPITLPHNIPAQPLYAHNVVDCDCLGSFEPMPGKKYVVSAWTREVTLPTVAAGITNYTAPNLKISFTSSSVVYTFAPKGNVIDGWQQIFETFDIPANATGVKVELVNTSSNRNVFFDDIRLHPNDGNMVSYVYDPVSLKTLAELDANNYATVYVYDDEGHLNKVKKETTEGFKMIKEGRINTKKINE